MKMKTKTSAAYGRQQTLASSAGQVSTVRKIVFDKMNPQGSATPDKSKSRITHAVVAQHEHWRSIRIDVARELRRLQKLAAELDWVAHLTDVPQHVPRSSPVEYPGVFDFLRAQILHKEQLGKVRSSETYRATFNSFCRFRKGIDLPFESFDARLMELYEADMHQRGLSRNTSSFYLRILRTNYKLAVERGLTLDRHPFKHVYCGMDKTAKRSLTFDEIKRIKALDLSHWPAQDFARDMFLFSFCTRGMSFIDMAYLRKQDLRNGYLIYRRRKTGQLLTVEWTSQMQAIVDKYPHSSTQYLLPIIRREDGSERRQYQNQMMRINRRLKDVAARVELSVPLSLYYSRHSWATIARRKEIPLSIISEGLGHDSESTTQIYLDSIRSCEVDEANRKILKGL